ncbi:hypothetical protein VTL71DRAFT_3657 [Oculimacula yallundae]|uniref:Uncharacterized protein n=1 Tax=Oculimacula yallundae TaxID=86028 RepID=A0ABR4C3N5_9HELO
MTKPYLSEAIASCSYPVSGQYGPSIRFLFYLSIIAGAQGRHHLWLVRGALGSAMFLSSIAAFNAAVIVAQGVSLHFLDLDLFGTLALLLPSMSLLAVMMNWSVELSKSRARPFVLCWGFLVWLGLVFSACGLRQLSDGLEKDLSPMDCSASRSHIRGVDEAETVLLSIQFQKLLTGVLVTTILISIIGPLGLLVNKNWASDKKEYSSKPVFVPGMGMVSPAQGAGLGSFLLSSLGLGFVVSVILMEMILWRLPNGEGAFAIGQWGPLVGAALALTVSLVDHYFLKSDDSTPGKSTDEATADSGDVPMERFVSKYQANTVAPNSDAMV